MKTRTWYLSEKDFPSNSYCVPGVSMSDKERTEAVHLLNRARDVIGQHYGGYRIEVTIPEYDNEYIVARGHRVNTSGAIYHVLREIPQIIPELNLPILGYPIPFQRAMLEPSWVHGGLVLVAGAGGSGKSTTMSSILISRLKTFGGLAITLEDPPEYNLQGQHGKGVCMQFPVKEQDDFANLMLDALRCYPAGLTGSILLVGEIRSPEVAALVTESALSGHLVLTTIHAMSIESAISRLCTLAGQVHNTEIARADVAESLRAVIHQKMINRKPEINVMINNDNERGIASKIRNGQFHQISADILRQKVLFQ